MKALKKEIFFILLFMVIGIAAVTTNVVGNMSTSINQNPDDFLVYFSDVKVNGTKDLSLVKSENELVFDGEFSAIGDKKVITYDVTNASKNYDAEVSINCTNSTNYLTISNSFDTNTNLSASSSKTGTLTVELTTAVSSETTQEIKCTINANAVERTTQGSGSVSVPAYPYYIGSEISIGTEKFNVISDNGDTITMLAQQGLNSSYRQSINAEEKMFSKNGGWETSPGPKEIDIQIWSTYPKEYINEYVTYLQEETGETTLGGDLITLTELKKLGCTIQEDYSYTGKETCANSPYKSWLIINGTWWTRSDISSFNDSVYKVGFPGNGDYAIFTQGIPEDNFAEIRPVITVSKEALENMNNSSESKRHISELNLTAYIETGLFYLSDIELNNAIGQGADLYIRVYLNDTAGSDTGAYIESENSVNEFFCYSEHGVRDQFIKIVLYDSNNVFEGEYIVYDWHDIPSIRDNCGPH